MMVLHPRNSPSDAADIGDRSRTLVILLSWAANALGDKSVFCLSTVRRNIALDIMVSACLLEVRRVISLQFENLRS